MYSDFIDYGWLDAYMQKVYSGYDRKVEKKLVISTLQSLYKMPKSYFEQFGCVIGDDISSIQIEITYIYINETSPLQIQIWTNRYTRWYANAQTCS